jgi:hypothetical protein
MLPLHPLVPIPLRLPLSTASAARRLRQAKGNSHVIIAKMASHALPLPDSAAAV